MQSVIKFIQERKLSSPILIPNICYSGDTLYSERFVLSILLNLTKIEKPLSDDKEFEKILCNLWDMTIEKDVVRLLLKHGVLEIFAGIIQSTEDNRLIEIIVGIIGNMSCYPETREILISTPYVVCTLLDLIGTSDTLTLVQLMRFIHAVLVFENSGDEIVWFQHFKVCENFVEKFAFILSSSMNNQLLINAFEALNSICTKFSVIDIQPDIKDTSFQDLFVTPLLISGILEANKQILPDSDLNEELDAPTDKIQKAMNLFLDVNVILSQYESISIKAFEPFLDELYSAVSVILTPLTYPIYLLPLSSNEQGVIENINELFQTLGDKFHEKCFYKLIKIWWLIEDYRETQIKSEWEADDEISANDITMTILEFLTRTSRNCKQEDITNCLKFLNIKIVEKLFNVMSAGDEEDIIDCCNKIKFAAKELWKIELISQLNNENGTFSDCEEEDEMIS